MITDQTMNITLNETELSKLMSNGLLENPESKEQILDAIHTVLARLPDKKTKTIEW